MQNKIYIHIGYPKCASTFLHKEILLKDKRINLLNKDFEILNDEIAKIKYLNDDEYNLEKKKIFESLQKKINIVDQVINIYSNSGILNFDINKLDDKKRTFNRLCEIFLSHSKVDELCFIVIKRDTYDLIYSLFCHNIESFKKANIKNHKDFIYFIYNNETLDYLNWKHLEKIIHLHEFYFLSFENLNKNFNTFLEKFYNILGLNVNREVNNVATNESATLGFGFDIYKKSKNANLFFQKISNSIFYKYFLRLILNHKLRLIIKKLLFILIPSKIFLRYRKIEKILNEKFKYI